MFARALLVVFVALLAMACAETARCPMGQIFDSNGQCVDIPDAGTGDG